jgi:hypothetical protein
MAETVASWLWQGLHPLPPTPPPPLQGRRAGSNNIYAGVGLSRVVGVQERSDRVQERSDRVQERSDTAQERSYTVQERSDTVQRRSDTAQGTIKRYLELQCNYRAARRRLK